MVNLSVPAKPTLFHSKYFSSSRPLWLLMEMGLISSNEKDSCPVHLQTITMDQLKKDPVLTKLNPQRRLPFFFDPTNGENLSLNESGGLVQYLLETYDSEFKFHPAPGDKTRPEFLKLIHFGPATAYNTIVPLLFSDGRSEEQVESKKREWHDVVVPTLEQALDKYGGPFMLGETFSAADAVVGYDVMTASFTKFSKELLGSHPKLEKYHQTICARPAYKELFTPDETDPPLA